MRALRVVAVALLVAAPVITVVATRSQPSSPSAIWSGLDSTACPSADRCVAVGFVRGQSGVEVPLAMTWDGRGWLRGHVPPPSEVADSLLSGLACPSATSCVAVGHQDIPTKYFGAGTAGGSPVAAVWDGHAWRTEKLSSRSGAADGELGAVSCASSTLCMAVGSQEDRAGREFPLAQSWDGSGWRIQPTPTPDFADDSVLDAVSCAAPTSCVAVGHYEYEVQEITTHTAVLIERWDGLKWRIERGAAIPGSHDAELHAVACPTPTQCMAAGFQRVRPGVFAPLAEVWDGASWAVSDTITPPGSPDAELSAVACPRPDRCLAVGYSRQQRGVVTLVEGWDGSAWSVQPSPNPSGSAASALIGIDCASPASCLAVGAYRVRSLVQVAFAQAWDGRAWRLLPTPIADRAGPAA